MNDNQRYKIYSNLDHPQRLFGFTLDEVFIAALGGIFLSVSNQKVLVILFSLSIMAGVRRLKKNKGPRFLLVLAYWYLPHFVTKWFLPSLPDSSKRLWKA